MKKVLSLFLVILALFLISCNQLEEKKEYFVYNLEIDGETSVEIGKEIILEPLYEYDDVNVQFNFVWEIDKENVAAIDDGIVTGVSAGEATVTLKDTVSNLEATLKITVYKKEEPVIKTTSLKIQVENKTILIGDELVLAALYDANSEVDLVWSIDNNVLATLTNNKLIANDEGQVTVTLKDKVSSLENSVVITIEKPYVPVTYTIDDMLDLGFGTSRY